MMFPVTTSLITVYPLAQLFNLCRSCWLPIMLVPLLLPRVLLLVKVMQVVVVKAVQVGVLGGMSFTPKDDFPKFGIKRYHVKPVLGNLL